MNSKEPILYLSAKSLIELIFVATVFTLVVAPATVFIFVDYLMHSY